MSVENETLEEFDQLIETRNLAGLLPFLQEKSKLHREALQAHLLEAKVYWVDPRDVTLDPAYQGQHIYRFQRRGDGQQVEIIVLSAMALLNTKDIQRWNEPFDFLKRLNNFPASLAILEWAKPRWIESYLLRRFRARFRSVLPYRVLRSLEQAGLISYQPAMTAFSLSAFEHWDHTNTMNEREIITSLKHFLEDPLMCQRDIPQLFNYETWIAHVSVGYKQDGVDGYLRFPIWTYLYQKLLSDNKMDRRFFIENALRIQTKEWNKDLKAFYRNLLEKIKLELGELLECQEIIFSFFQANDVPVIALGLDLCKKMHLQPGFNLPSFLEWIGPLMLRADAKKAIKSALPFLEKIAKLQPAFRGTIAEMVADVFSIPQLELQERATVTLLKLNVLDSIVLKEKINAYLPQLQGNVKQTLEPWLDAENIALADPAPELYIYQAQKEKLLIQPIQLPNTWNDILFQIGKFISSDEPHEAEILLHAFICKRHLFPENYAEQLSPYHKQLEQIFWDIDYKNDLKRFLKGKLPDLNAVYTRYWEGTRIPLELMEKLLLLVEDKMQRQSSLPLLCEPTHLPYWIEPKVLLARIIAYQKNQEPIQPLDLSIAMARMCREGIEAAIPLLQEVDEQLQPLLKFCLGLESKICLYDKKNSEQWMPLVQGTYIEKLALWAVAARTYDPTGVFNEFSEKLADEVAFVVHAFRPQFYFRKAWEDGKIWEELAIGQLELFKLPQNLLYSLGFHYNLKPSRGDYYHRADVLFWHSIMPLNPEPLAIELATSSCRNGDFGRANMQGFLTIVDRPEFWFSDPSTLAFACCFLQERKETRFLATEVLIQVIEKRKLDLTLFGEKLAFLISGNYGVLMRCVDALAAIKDVSSVHNTALFTIFDTLLANLKFAEKLPLNFKKLLEHYLDMLVKTKQKPAEAAQVFLMQWQNIASIKKLIKQILHP